MYDIFNTTCQSSRNFFLLRILTIDQTWFYKLNSSWIRIPTRMSHRRLLWTSPRTANETRKSRTCPPSLRCGRVGTQRWWCIPGLEGHRWRRTVPKTDLQIIIILSMYCLRNTYKWLHICLLINNRIWNHKISNVKFSIIKHMNYFSAYIWK